MRLLVTGKTGQVALSLAEVGRMRNVDIVLVGRPELDLETGADIEAVIAGARPDAVISAAAYTAVDKAESERDVAFAINAIGAGLVSAAAKRLGVPILHLSTDYVFDGSQDRPYREDDETCPLSIYGASKLEGERLVAERNPDHVIFRTAWVYSPFGNNFVKTMLRLGATRSELGVIADQHGCPTSALDIAATVITIAEQLTQSDARQLRGIFHLTGTGRASWADFASHVFSVAETEGRAPLAVKRITTAEYPTLARRPANSLLSGKKLHDRFGIRLPDWKQSTDHVVKRLLSSNQG